jgi:hypothetical protein
MAAWKTSGTLKSHLPEPRLLDAAHNFITPEN